MFNMFRFRPHLKKERQRKKAFSSLSNRFLLIQYYLLLLLCMPIIPIIRLIYSWKWAHESFHYYNHRIDSRNAKELLNFKTNMEFCCFSFLFLLFLHSLLHTECGRAKRNWMEIRSNDDKQFDRNFNPLAISLQVSITVLSKLPGQIIANECTNNKFMAISFHFKFRT